MKEISLIYTSFASENEASEIAQNLVNGKLAACTHLYPIRSCYHWDGATTQEDECMLRIKTLATKTEEVLQWLDENHPYDVPMIQHSRVSVNPSYYKWMLGCLEKD